MTWGNAGGEGVVSSRARAADLQGGTGRSERTGESHPF